MTGITATELELLACFGVEPIRSGEEVPWVYDGSVYSLRLGEFHIAFSVQPSYRDIGMTVQLRDLPLYDLHARGVRDLMVIDEPGVDALEIRLTERETLRVQLRPSFSVTHSFAVD
jgi:hypothetical protein